GRCELGELAGIERITATLGASSQTWWLGDDAQVPSTLHAASGRDLVIAIPANRDARELIARTSLVETRQFQPVRHAKAVLEPLAGGIIVHGLAAGEYVLRAPGLGSITIRVARDGIELAGHVVTAHDIVELSRMAPAIAALEAN